MIITNIDVPAVMDAMIKLEALCACFLPSLNFPASKLDFAYNYKESNV